VDATVGDGGGLPPGYVPAAVELDLRCKLVNGRNLDDPTANDTHHRANLRGTDLGIPVVHGDQLYVFFGDTAGAQQIWPLGRESLPDAVGYAEASAAEVAADPTRLCAQLRFLTTGGATGPVEADFAGASMTPPPGHDLAEYIHAPAGPRGAGLFPSLPGDFEVPSGAFSAGGSIYLFYTTINQDPFEMRGSYLARWATPSTTGVPAYDILYAVDERFDDAGPLRGDFINIAALVDGPYVYLYGTGAYRASPVHLARKRLDDLATPGGFERYDAATGAWVGPDAATAPIVPEPGLGEVSVRHVPAIDRYVMLDQEITAGNRIAARFAEAPEGPWSAPVTVATMGDPGFAARYCCLGTDCPGERLMECDHAGFYGTYLLPGATVDADGAFTLSFLMSTWIPYNVVLMTATFR
ncbi:MAG: DUF4185 domain-containing protein, partial [Myxococcales bacterium]|nr:DUF4185 domain-containing protein [Myxococcales bacterium]